MSSWRYTTARYLRGVTYSLAVCPASPFSIFRQSLCISNRRCASFLSTEDRSTGSASELDDSPEMDLDDYEALLLQSDGGPAEDGGEEALSGSDDNAHGASSRAKNDGEEASRGGGGETPVHVLVAEVIETVRDVLPVDGSSMRLTDLTPSIDMEVLERLPPPPGSSCLSFVQFLQMHPKHFHLKQQGETVRTAGGKSGVVQRWFVRRADIAAAVGPPSPVGPVAGREGRQGGTSLGGEGEGAGGAPRPSELDQLDLTSLFMEEEMRSVLEGHRVAPKKSADASSSGETATLSGEACSLSEILADPTVSSAGRGADAAEGTGAAGRPPRRRRRLQSVNSLSSGMNADAIETSEAGAGPPATEETKQVWERVAGAIQPGERLTALQLRTRLMEEDGEVLEWLAEQRGGGSTPRETTDGGVSSSSGVGFRRLLWEHAAVAKRFLDYDAASPEGWISRAGVLQHQFPLRPVWEKPSSPVTSSHRLDRDESFAADWDVELNLDEEDPAVATAMEDEGEDGEEGEADAGDDSAGLKRSGGTAAPHGTLPPPLSRKERKRLERERREKQASLSRTIITSPEELLAEHTRLAEARGWRSPEEILDLLVECVPTFPVPVDQLVLSDVLIKLFGFKLSMKRLVLIYSYYVVYEKDTLPSPTVCLHPERVVGKHPNAGVANPYYKRWEGVVYERAGAGDTTATYVSSPIAPATPQTANTSGAAIHSTAAGVFAPLRRTIKSRVVLRPKGGECRAAATTADTRRGGSEGVPVAASPMATTPTGEEKDLAQSKKSAPNWGRPLSDSAVAMHDLLQATTPSNPSPPRSSRFASHADGTVRPTDSFSGVPQGITRTTNVKGATLMLEALQHIYDPVVRQTGTATLSSSLLLLMKLVLAVPYNQFIPLEEAARRCGCDCTDAVEDLLDRSQPTQSRYAAFLVHTSAATVGGSVVGNPSNSGLAAVPSRRRRLVRLRPWWIAPNSTGDLAAAPECSNATASPATASALPASFLKRLMPTWRPVQRLLSAIPEEDRKALLAASAHAASLGQYLQLFGRSSCWVEEHLGAVDSATAPRKDSEATESGGTSDGGIVVDPRLRVRRYTGDLEMDDVEPLCLRALYYCCSAKELLPLDTLLEAAEVAEREAREKLGLVPLLPPSSNERTGMGLGNMLRESKLEMHDLPKHLARHQTLFELQNKPMKSNDLNPPPPALTPTPVVYIKRRSMFTVQMTAGKR